MTGQNTTTTRAKATTKRAAAGGGSTPKAGMGRASRANSTTTATATKSQPVPLPPSLRFHPVVVRLQIKPRVEMVQNRLFQPDSLRQRKRVDLGDDPHESARYTVVVRNESERFACHRFFYLEQFSRILSPYSPNV
jgi:hypothetical protein